MIRTTVKALYLGRPIVWEIEDIVRFESENKYTVAHRADGKELLITDSIRKLSAELEDKFIQLNRSTLVRRDLVLEVKSYSGLMEGEANIKGLTDPISCGRRYVSAVKRFIRERAQ